MKIVDNRKPKTIQFNDVKVSDIFRYGENYYMKIKCELVEKHRFAGIEIVGRNAISLDDGELVNIDRDQQVEIVDCELVIK